MASSLKNLPRILALIYVSLINHGLITMMTILASKPIYEPKENIAINCGSPDEPTAQDNRKWIADHDKDSRYSLIESDESQSKSSAFKARSQDAVETVPYMTARVSRSQFTYSFRLTPGPKFIRLHFYPTRYIGLDDFDPTKAYFAVKAGRFTLLRNFSAYLTAQSSKDKTVKKEFCVYMKEDMKKHVTFIPSPSPGSENHTNSTSYVFVNGIEIVSMPDTLYYTPPGDRSPHLIGQSYNFGDYTDQALQTVHRLNVGGGYIPPDRDTGMYREWTPDYPKYFKSQGFVPSNTRRELNYTKIPSYTAPNDVYRTATTMGNNATYNNLRNITWKLPVDSWFKYLVRLHFCEFQELYTTSADRMFRINIDNQTAESAFSVIKESSGNSIPVYKDYVVNIMYEAFLFVDLYTRPEDSTHEDAILNGMEVFKMSNSTGNLAGLNPPLPVPPGYDQPVNPTDKSKSKNTLLAVALGSGIAGFVVLLSMACCVVWLRLRKDKRHHSPYKRKSNGSTKLASSGSLPEQLCHCFSLSEIKIATNNFDPGLVIGRGGFGYVYNGHLTDEASSVVAIKRLNKGLSGQGEREFEAEIKMLSQLRHVHLVSLIGYCDDDGEMILVYDYMANGTLRDHLYGKENEPLSWRQRLKICVGAAKGLHYLHSEVKNTVIHRDVKTTNILLDEKWEAKVADFGLSKLGPGDSAAVSTAVKGTFGYMDPEYAQSQQLTDKSDVYSFGVVLFEVLCARKPVDVKLEEDQRNLAQWARKSVREGKIHEIIDPYLIGKIVPECFKKFVEVAERCVRDYTNQRPTMREVMEMLEFALELQEQADAVKQSENPGGVSSYPEQLSFHLADDNRGSGYDVLGLRSGAGFTTTVDSNSTGSSFPTLNSDSGTREIFSDATNFKLISQK